VSAPALSEITLPLVPYLIAAVAMVAVNLYLLSRLFPRKGPGPHAATGILVIGLMLAGLGLWFAVIYAILSPGDASIVSVFIAGNSMMAVLGAWFIGLVLRAEEKPLPRHGWGWPVLVSLLLIGNELVMSVTFSLATTGPAYYSALGWSGLGALFGDSVTSVWFFWPMLATMMFVILRVAIAGPERRLLIVFTATAAAGPWIVSNPTFGVVVMAALMGAVVWLYYRDGAEGAPVELRHARILVGVGAGFGVMFAGQALSYALAGTPWGTLPFALASVAVMTAEFYVLAGWGFAGAHDVPAPESAAPSAPPLEAPTTAPVDRAGGSASLLGTSPPSVRPP
jgi:hypothetical protein